MKKHDDDNDVAWLWPSSFLFSHFLDGTSDSEKEKNLFFLNRRHHHHRLPLLFLPLWRVLQRRKIYRVGDFLKSFFSLLKEDFLGICVRPVSEGGGGDIKSRFLLRKEEEEEGSFALILTLERNEEKKEWRWVVDVFP